MSKGLAGKQILNAVHGAVIFGRRVEALADALASAIPAGPAKVLDLGCGDGQVAVALMRRRPELTVEGVDVFVRPVTHIPVTPYDGVTLPFAEASFDHVTVVDVLHHTDDPAAVLKEAARVAARSVIVKDHLREGWLAEPLLRLNVEAATEPSRIELPPTVFQCATPGSCRMMPLIRSTALRVRACDAASGSWMPAMM